MKMLFSAYRLDQYADADGFIAQAALVMSGYATEVVEYATDPRTGIQRYSKWPPTISEIVEAIEFAKAIIAGHRLIAEKGAQGLVWDNHLNKFVPRPPVQPSIANNGDTVDELSNSE